MQRRPALCSAGGAAMILCSPRAMIIVGLGMIFLWVSFLYSYGATRPATADSPEVARIELGERLFQEQRLSADGALSCARCHQPARAFTDGLPTAQNARGEALARNTPSLLFIGQRESFGGAGEV